MFCGRHFVPLLFLFLPLLSQAQPDTLPVHAGTVSVRRPRTPAAYSVKMNYMYTGVTKHFIFFSRKEIVFADSNRSVLPPQPFTGQMDQPVKSEVLLNTYPKEDFDWDAFLKTMDYSFAFEDSTKSDSAQFVINVSKNGDVKVRLIPYKGQDSTGREFEREAAKKMVTLNNWYPARSKVQRDERVKRYDTTIIVTVYAKDPAEGRLMPLEVLPGK